MPADRDLFDDEVEDVKTLARNDKSVTELETPIDDTLSEFVSSNKKFGGFEELFSSLEFILRGEVTEGDEQELSEALVNIVANADNRTIDALREEADDSVARFIQRIKTRHGLDLQRKINRLRQGKNYWTNIKTEAVYRTGRPTFHHEITIDYQETVRISSSPNANLDLATHLLEQTSSLPETLGEDAFETVERAQVEEVREKANELIEMMDEKDEDDVEEISDDE